MGQRRVRMIMERPCATSGTTRAFSLSGTSTAKIRGVNHMLTECVQLCFSSELHVCGDLKADYFSVFSPKVSKFHSNLSPLN